MMAAEKNKKSKEIQAAIFLNLIGEYGRQLCNNFNMEVADKKAVAKLMAEFEKFCAPKKNVIYERFKFNQRSQKDGETFDSFLTDIQKLIRTCDFQEEDNMLRDRIVIGISDTRLQEKLLGREDELSKDKVISLCRAAEVAKKQAKELGEQKTNSGCIDSVSLNYNKFHEKSNKFDKINQKYNQNKNQCKKSKCSMCNWIHDVNKCPAMGLTCNRCGNSNHFAKMCNVKKKEKGKSGESSYVFSRFE